MCVVLNFCIACCYDAGVAWSRHSGDDSLFAWDLLDVRL